MHRDTPTDMSHGPKSFQSGNGAALEVHCADAPCSYQEGLEQCHSLCAELGFDINFEGHGTLSKQIICRPISSLKGILIGVMVLMSLQNSYLQGPSQRDFGGGRIKFRKLSDNCLRSYMSIPNLGHFDSINHTSA